MKKLILIITALAVLAFSACGADTENSVSKDLVSADSHSSAVVEESSTAPSFSADNSEETTSTDSTEDSSADSSEDTDPTLYSGNFGYKLVNTVAMLCDYKGSETELELPSELDGYTLTAVTDGAFANDTKLKKLSLSDTVVNVSDGAFNNCTSLEYVYIGSSVAALSITAFEGCSTLKEIEVSGANKNYSSLDGILYNGDKTELVRCPAAIEEEEITVPDTVASVGEYAFENCKGVKKVILPDACGLKEGSFFYCMDLEETVFGSDLTEIPAKCFFGCVMLKEIKVPSGVTAIGDYAFFGCISAKAATLPESVTQMGENVFKSCSALKKISVEGEYLKEWYNEKGKDFINS